MDTECNRTVVFICDAGQTIGVGHVMRSLALAEELMSRGVRVEMIADLVEVPWAMEAVSTRGIKVIPRPADELLLGAVIAARPAALVVDGYTVPREVLHSARLSFRTLVMVDGNCGTPDADVVVDQNVGAHERADAVDADRSLTGLQYALIRDDVLAHRPKTPPRLTSPERAPRVLVVMGGTDAFNLTPLVLAALVGSAASCQITAVTRQSAADVAPDGIAPNQTLKVTPPGPAYAGLVAGSDLVISAAGSSVWELFALGSCAALISVADNQASGYRGAVEHELALGLGTANLLRTEAGFHRVAEELRRLLSSPHERAALSLRAWHAVDGQGRARIADALLAFR